MSNMFKVRLCVGAVIVLFRGVMERVSTDPSKIVRKCPGNPTFATTSPLSATLALQGLTFARFGEQCEERDWGQNCMSFG